MIYVIGSGPTGVSCAYALVKKGLNVTMLDAGFELEPWRRHFLEALKKRTPEQWDEASVSTIKSKMPINVRGIPRKLVYGSDFPYLDTVKWLAMEADGAKITPSLAKGGLSNVWGAAVLPYTESDIADWPISLAELVPHYESVLSFMHLSAVKDDLASILPLYCNNHRPLRLSRQAKALLEDLEQHKDILRAEGFVFGHSRLAVRSYPSSHDPGCVYCGLCLYGCPYELIYNSAHTLTELLLHDNFHYIKDIIVQKVTDQPEGVIVSAVSRESGEKLSFHGSRIYLACGAVSTTKILLESLGAYDRPVKMRDSQWFLIPLLRYRKVSGVANEDLHTLSQVFIELTDSTLSNNTIHLQVYTYNDMYAAALKNALGKMCSILNLPIQELLSRLIVIQGYLHSNSSSVMSVRLTSPGGKDKLVVRAEPRDDMRKILKRIVAKLSKNRKNLSAVPVPWLLQIGEPGSGNHIGGTFPMKSNPSNFESDYLGRPYGFQKVHVVDATIFPSIPATSITLTAMANAHRIASLCGEA
jgi:choline dehydrogenase-like flavoprotein